MFFLVYGEDTYRSRKKLTQLREQFSAKRDATGLNVRTLHAGDDSIERVLEEIYASPFLAEKKMVVLEGYLQESEADQERLKIALEKKPESTIVIFFEDVDASTLESSPLFPLLSTQKYSEAFSPLSGREAERFVQDEGTAMGVTFEPKALALLVGAAAGDAWSLQGNIAKVASFVRGSGRSSVTVADVESLVVHKHEESIFETLDACIEGRSREAVAMLERMFAAGTAELQITAMLLKQFRLLLAARDLMDRGVGDAAVIAKKLGVHPYPAGKAMATAKKFTSTRLLECRHAVLDIDRAVKTGAAKPKVMLDVFIVSLGLSRARS